MSSQLTSVSTAVRQYGLTVIFSLIGLIIVWNLGNAAYSKITAPKATPTPPANVIFGKLDALQFKDKPNSSLGLRINLETIDGKIPLLATPSAVVYEIEKQSAGLDYSENAEKAAEQAGFINPQIQEDGQVAFIYIDPTDQNRRMRYDFSYANLEYKYENINSYVSLEIGSTPTAETASANAQAFMRGVHPKAWGRLEESKTNLLPKATYYYLEPATSQLQEVVTQTQANLTVLNYPNLSIKNFPVIGPSATESLVRFVYTGITSSAERSRQTRLLQAQIVSWPIILNPQKPATYPLKSQTTAWNELLAGKASVLHTATPGEEYNVRRIYMAYFAPNIQAKYIQPVWVFEGDKPEDSKFLFRAIVPAVAEPYSTSIH